MEFLEPEIDSHVSDDGSEGVQVAKVKKTEVVKEEQKKKKKSIFEDADISSMSPQELVALFKKHTKKAYPKLSDLELDELSLIADGFGQGSGLNAELGRLEKFVTEVVDPEWGQKVDEQKPYLLIISSSAIRCVDVLKALPKLRNKCTIAKLFAKHFKLADQLAFLGSHRCPMAIGTPARIHRLGQEEGKPIDLEAVTHILMDSGRDGKDRTVFDVAEIRKELVDLLVRTPLLTRLNSGACHIHFF